MARSLVIVESPGKIKTISRYLGKDYVVKSSIGHVRDLPTSRTDTKRSGGAARRPSLKGKSAHEKERIRKINRRKTMVDRMGVDPDHDWQVKYEILPSREKVVNELRTAAQKADKIYLATDLDREGEAIAWHLKEAIGGDDERYVRVIFNEITQSAINRAFESPGVINEHRVNAQQARRFLDRVVGFELTPLLYAKVARGLSAGRVQSVAVRMVVEREREIRAFTPVEYWNVFAALSKQDSTYSTKFEVVHVGKEKFEPHNEVEAQDAIYRLTRSTSSGESSYVVTAVETKRTSTKPNAPFITTTLQQASSTRLNFTVRKTMTLAQQLYEHGYITYMRTDSTNLSNDAVQNVRQHISSEYGDSYLPESSPRYSSKASAQEAHEAIRPTAVANTVNKLIDIDTDAKRLYELIWKRFVASQMTPAVYENTAVTVTCADYELRTSGRVLIFDGFTRVFTPSLRKDEPPLLPNFDKNEVLNCVDTEKVQHFTKPKPRYSEARLVSELEKQGIGRPSTYADILTKIQERGYVSLHNKRFRAERIGELVTDRLIASFSQIMDYAFTAHLEEKLDEIAEGKTEWKSVLNRYYGTFSNEMKAALDPDGGMQSNEPIKTDIKCPKCERSMNLRIGSTGMFLGCEGYAAPPKDRCTQTMNLSGEIDVASVDDDDDELEIRRLLTKPKCPDCETGMDGFLINESTKLNVCGNTPVCRGNLVEHGHYKLKGYDGPIVECDKCNADMQLKSGRFGKYFACTNTACNHTRKLLRNGEVAPPRADPIPMPELGCPDIDDYFVLRDGAAGLFLAASKYPKHRMTRTPLVEEVQIHANELDPKFKYLLTAPIADPKGNPTKLRFSRKDKVQYVSSEAKGKDTGWRAYFRDGVWQASQTKRRSSRPLRAKRK